MSFQAAVDIVARQAAPDLDGPAGVPPPGVTPNLDNPHNGNYIAIPFVTVCVILVAFLYLIRFYAKWQTKKWNVADYLSVIAFPIFWVYVYYSYKLSWSPGYMIHQWDMKLKFVPEFSFICWIATLLYFVLVALIKSAILLEWTEIFVTSAKKSYFAWACYGTAAAMTCLSIILFSMDMANCTPFERNYNPLLPNSFCRFDVPKFGLASAITNLVLDIVPIILAQNVIWKLHLTLVKKLSISVIFLIGVIGIVICIVRVVYAVQFFSSTDTTYFFSILALCSLGETTCAILVLCAPFAPKAFVSVQQTKVVTGVRKHMTLRTNTAYGNNSTAFHELTDHPGRSKPLIDSYSSQEYERSTDRIV